MEITEEKPAASVLDYSFDKPAADFGKSAMLDERDSKPKTSSSLEYSVGDKVKHRKFGIGVITAAQSMGADYLLKINFPEGEKKLLAVYAPIEKIED